MMNFRFRTGARAVAIIDLILSSMSLCLTILLVIGAFIFSTSPLILESSDDEVNIFRVRQSEHVKKIIIIWTVVVFSGITTIVEIVGAIKLLNATQLGQDPKNALKLCTFWRRVCIAFTIILVIGDILFLGLHKDITPILTVVQILLRILAIYIVTQFIKELDKNIETQQVQVNYSPQLHSNPDFNSAPPSYYEVVKEQEEELRLTRS